MTLSSVNFTGRQPSELRLSASPSIAGGDQRHDPDGTPKCVGETEQAFVSRMRGINRPTTIRFGRTAAAFSWTTARARSGWFGSGFAVVIRPMRRCADPGHRDDLEDQPHRTTAATTMTMID